MNNNDDFSIKITESLFSRCASEHYKNSLGKSDFARGMFCLSLASDIAEKSMLCVFLDGRYNFISTMVLSDDFSKNHDRILSKITDHAPNSESVKVLLARRITDSLDIDYTVGGALLIAHKLWEENIELLGYYLFAESSYINILPEKT